MIKQHVQCMQTCESIVTSASCHYCLTHVFIEFEEHHLLAKVKGETLLPEEHFTSSQQQIKQFAADAMGKVDTECLPFSHMPEDPFLSP